MSNWVLSRQSDTSQSPKLFSLPMAGDLVKIGRSENSNLRLKSLDPSVTMMVSRYHATMRYDPTNKVVLLKDIDSVNGVFLNGKKVKNVYNEVTLSENDIVSFGSEAGEFSYILKREGRETPAVDKIVELKGQIETLKNKSQQELKKKQEEIKNLEFLYELEKKEKGLLITDKESLTEKMKEIEIKLEESTSENSMFVTKLQKLKEVLECPVCFNLRTNSMLILKCGHILCSQCLKEWQSQKKEQSKCPCCNAKVNEKPSRAFVLDKCVDILEEKIIPKKREAPSPSKQQEIPPPAKRQQIVKPILDLVDLT